MVVHTKQPRRHRNEQLPGWRSEELLEQKWTNRGDEWGSGGAVACHQIITIALHTTTKTERSRDNARHAHRTCANASNAHILDVHTAGGGLVAVVAYLLKLR